MLPGKDRVHCRHEDDKECTGERGTATTEKSVVAVLCHYGSGLAAINGNNKETGQMELNTSAKMDVISWWVARPIWPRGP